MTKRQASEKSIQKFKKIADVAGVNFRRADYDGNILVAIFEHYGQFISVYGAYSFSIKDNVQEIKGRIR